jgi:hypothetical protein
MQVIFAILANTGDKVAFVIGVLTVIGILLLARYLPEYWVGDDTND